MSDPVLSIPVPLGSISELDDETVEFPMPVSTDIYIVQGEHVRAFHVPVWAGDQYGVLEITAKRGRAA